MRPRSPPDCKSLAHVSHLKSQWLLFQARKVSSTALTHPFSFINNEFVPGIDGKTFDTINPTNEKPICAVHEALENDVDRAVAAARKAFTGEWSRIPPSERGKMITRLADLMERDAKTLAALESLDNGKALGIALTADVPMAYNTMRYYGGWADKIEGKTIDMNADHFCYTRQEAVRTS